MKRCSRFTDPSNSYLCFIFSIAASVAFALPLSAQRPFAGTPERVPVSDDSAPNAEKTVAVMVEMDTAPAGVAYAEALKTAQAQFDTARANAL